MKEKNMLQILQKGTVPGILQSHVYMLGGGYCGTKRRHAGGTKVDKNESLLEELSYQMIIDMEF